MPKLTQKDPKNTSPKKALSDTLSRISRACPMKRPHLLLLLLLVTSSIVGVTAAFADEKWQADSIVPSSPQQGWRLFHYDNRDGLSHNSVKCIYEDSNGFLWFGTKNGLNRFDGQGFKTYVYDGKPGSLQSSIIYDLLEDNKSRMWVATADGIFIYFPIEDVFRRFDEVVKSDIVITDIVWRLKKDDDGCIWILSQNGIYTFYNNILVSGKRI